MNISSEHMKIEREKSMMEESIHNNGHITLDCVLVTQYKTTTHSHSMHSKLKQINSTADRLHSTMCQTGSYSMLSCSHTQFRRKMKFPFGFIGIRVSICGFVCLFSAARQDWKYFLLLFLFFLFGSSSLPHRFTWHEWKKMHYNHKRFMAVKTCRITWVQRGALIKERQNRLEMKKTSNSVRLYIMKDVVIAEWCRKSITAVS